MQISPTGAPTRADYSVRKGDGTAIPGELQSLSVRISRDSAYLVGHRSAGDTVSAIAAHGDVLPFAQGSYGLYEIALSRLVSGRDSMQLELVPFSITARATTPVRRGTWSLRSARRLAQDGAGWSGS